MRRCSFFVPSRYPFKIKYFISPLKQPSPFAASPAESRPSTYQNKTAYARRKKRSIPSIIIFFQNTFPCRNPACMIRFRITRWAAYADPAYINLIIRIRLLQFSSTCERKTYKYRRNRLLNQWTRKWVTLFYLDFFDRLLFFRRICHILLSVNITRCKIQNSCYGELPITGAQRLILCFSSPDEKKFWD